MSNNREQRELELSGCIENNDVLRWRAEYIINENVAPITQNKINAIHRNRDFIRRLDSHTDYWILHVNTDFKAFKRWLDNYPEILDRVDYRNLKDFAEFKAELYVTINTLNELWQSIIKSKRELLIEQYAIIERINKECDLIRSLRASL